MNDPYKIPGSDKFQNKLGITDAEKLKSVEADISISREAELQLTHSADTLDLQYLKDTHKKLLGDVYEWAGELRTVEIAKGTSFSPTQHIESFTKSVFKDLKKENNLVGLDKDNFTDRAAHYLGEINAVRPFREGNGRTQRAFMDQLAGRAGYAFDWKKTNQKEMIEASIDRFNEFKPTKMKALLNKALVEPLQEILFQTKLKVVTYLFPGHKYDHQAR